jgi:hypothetical protein
MVIGKENQQFKGTDVVAILLLVALCVFFYAFPMTDSVVNEKAVSSRSKAEILGYQLAQIYRDQIMEKNQGGSQGRGPASEDNSLKKEGFIGEDSWGKPFQYQIIEQSKESLKIIISNKHSADTANKDQEPVYVELVVPMKDAS